jgi:hypothetical protein
MGVTSTVAEGPGIIVFECAGQPNIVDDQEGESNSEAVCVFPSTSLIAFDLRARFNLQLNNSVADFYLNTPTIKFLSGSTAILDVDAIQDNMGGLWELLKLAYNPI